MAYKDKETAKRCRAARYQRDKEKIKARRKAYYEANKEEILAKKKVYDAKNKEPIAAYQKKYRAAHPAERRAGLKRYYAKLKLANAELSRASLQAWAHQVKNGDENCCTVCGTTENLHAHHIFPKSIFPERALLIQNGVTLCEYHHKEHHQLNPLSQWKT